MARKKVDLGPTAEYVAPHVQCAHETCGLSAKVMQQTKTGWASLCLPHYERYHDEQARASLEAQGLSQYAGETRAQFTIRMRHLFRERARKGIFKDATQLEDEWAA